MGLVGWDLSAVQTTDMLMGIEAIEAVSEKQHIPLICANMFDEEGRPYFNSSYTFEIEDKRIGVLAVLEPDQQTTRKRLGREFTFGDAQEALRKGVKELRPHCDALILLFGGRREIAIERCNTIEGIDLIFYGLASSSQRVPAETEMGTPVYSAASRGKDFGEITLTFLDDGSLSLSPFTIHEITTDVEQEPQVLEFMTAFKAEAEQRKSRSREIRDAVSEMSEIYVSDNFIGVEKCMFCHEDIVEDYYTTAHASSYETLVDVFEENNSNCVSCHVTGWKEPGGFGQASTERRALDLVQCEACHGRGTAHSRDGSMVVNAPESCVRCHNDEMPQNCNSSRDFDYDEFWSQIAH